MASNCEKMSQRKTVLCYQIAVEFPKRKPCLDQNVQNHSEVRKVKQYQSFVENYRYRRHGHGQGELILNRFVQNLPT